MHTPHDHPDYQMLNKALSLADLNIKSFGEEEDGGSSSSTGKVSNCYIYSICLFTYEHFRVFFFFIL